MCPIESARLRLRPLVEGDLDEVFQILSDDETTASVSWRQPSIEGAKAWLLRRMDDQRRHGFSMWAIETRDPWLMVGLCGFFPRGDSLELGYVVKASHWRQRIGQEAVKLAIRAAAQRRVFAGIRASNTPSIRCAEGAGLHLYDQREDKRGLLLLYENDSLQANIRSSATF
jgi:RimJ/RimL family protein N-acetyltransferase